MQMTTQCSLVSVLTAFLIVGLGAVGCGDKEDEKRQDGKRVSARAEAPVALMFGRRTDRMDGPVWRGELMRPLIWVIRPLGHL